MRFNSNYIKFIFLLAYCINLSESMENKEGVIDFEDNYL